MKTLILEDNLEYVVADEKDINNIHYYLLAQLNNPNKICIRKKIIKDNVECISMLASEEELEIAMNEFNYTDKE